MACSIEFRVWVELKWCERHYKVGVHSVTKNGYVLTGKVRTNPVLSDLI